MDAHDQLTLDAETLRAKFAGKIAPDGTRYGSVDGNRTMIKTAPTSRQRCWCCKKRATHLGLGDGLGLMSGCELLVRRWVRDGNAAFRTRPGGEA